MRLTLIHPAIGRRPGDRSYIGTWQMEPLPIAAIAGLTPPGIDIRFHDDRAEDIPFDAPTDLVAISVETYTFRRAAQIASEYRRRGVKVVMGGFHATLRPDDAARFADAVVVGEAEQVWAELIDDARHGTLRPRYQGAGRAFAGRVPRYDRSVFHGKRYLPVGLVETARGCRHACSFCAVQSFFGRQAARRDLDEVVAELKALSSRHRLFFFVDDNFAAEPPRAKEFMRAIRPLGLRWITQLTIEAARDEEFVALARASGCRGVLIGFESLDPTTLRAMGKTVNTRAEGFAPALDTLRRHGMGVYGTFTFGHDGDTARSLDDAVEFAIGHGFTLAAFNHLTPFPGTPLYAELERQGRLRYDAWWLDPGYRYNEVPFHPAGLDHAELRRLCLAARRRFYGLGSIGRRYGAVLARRDGFMLRHHLPVNLMHRWEIDRRDGFPLGDEGWTGQLLEVA